MTDCPIDTLMLDVVTSIAVQAGDQILNVYRSTDFGITEKLDHSPLTEADLAAHRLIARELDRTWPAIPQLSEEAADIAYDIRRRWSRYWLIDPLDGTKEFIKRNDQFTVNIALIEHGRPLLGVVHSPALGITHCGAPGLGAHRIEPAGRAAIRTRKAGANPRVLVSHSHRDAATDALLARLPQHQAISRGSSFKFCLLAEGSADLYPRIGPTSEWDTAAGQAVLEAAGGLMLQLPGLARFTYNQKDSLLNPGFIAMGDAEFGWQDMVTV